MSNQCAGCSHWQARGGVVLERTYRCTAIHDSAPELGSNLDKLLTALAADYASRHQCPMYDPINAYPDAYRSVDLVDQG